MESRNTDKAGNNFLARSNIIKVIQFSNNKSNWDKILIWIILRINAKRKISVKNKRTVWKVKGS